MQTWQGVHDAQAHHSNHDIRSGRDLRQLCAGRHARWWHARARITCPDGPGKSDRPALADARCSPHRERACSTPSSARQRPMFLRFQTPCSNRPPKKKRLIGPSETSAAAVECKPCPRMRSAAKPRPGRGFAVTRRCRCRVLLELRNCRDGYARWRQRGHP